MTASLLHRMLAPIANWRRKHNILRVTKDGGPESTVWTHWLFESKRWGSIVLLRFENGSRDAYHSHAFDCVSWVLPFGGGLVEHRIGGPGANLKDPYLLLPSLLPVITRRAHLHKVISCGRTWVLSFRGPWQNNWQEVVGPDARPGWQARRTHARPKGDPGVSPNNTGLCDFEYRVLAMLDGGGEALPWGAALGAALGFLKGSGHVALEAGTYKITERGRAALATRAALA